MKLKTGQILVIFLSLGLIIYGWSINNGFIWDDEEQIVNNPLIRSLTNLPLFFSGGTFSSGFGGLSGLYFRPLMTTAYSLIYSLFGLNPGAFHLVQALIHIGSSWCLFLIFKRLMNSHLALILGLIFLVHPLNTESVLYAANLQDALYFFFGAWGLLMVLNQKIWLSLPLFLLSLLAKETGAVFLALGIFYLVSIKSKVITNYLGGSWLIISIYSILRFGVAKIFFNKQGLAPISLIPLVDRIKAIPQIISYYLTNTVYPADLTINQVWIVEQLNFKSFWLPLIITLAFVLVNWLLYRRRPGKISWLFLAWFWFGLAPHLQLFPLDLTVSPRFFYVSLAGLLGLIGYNLDHLKSGLWLNLTSLIIILAFSAISLNRTFDFKAGLSFYAHEIAHSGPNFNLENNYGVELFRHQEYDQAKSHFEKSIELAPHWWPNWNNLGAIYQRKKDYEAAEQAYLKAIANGRYYLAYQNLIGLYTNQLNQPEKAQALIDQLNFESSIIKQ